MGVKEGPYKLIDKVNDYEEEGEYKEG